MDVVKSILNSEIERINRTEGRDGKPRINNEFFIHHPWLCLAMFVGYIAVGVVMYASPYMGLGWFAGFTLFLVFMAAMLLLEIKPTYRYEDIGVLDLRVCYNGEWFFSREISSQAVDTLLQSTVVDSRFKSHVKSIVQNKGAIDFYDVYDLDRQYQSHVPASQSSKIA
ncbi:YlaC family protein [Serratia sp. M24T3]|uniref:YlaC family protein n=1 Tax=Rouxiella sp. WC2420 TaxID=3234145 RepID=A0AB39VKX6_9GAMM|nr:YlaC family protein [Serratia sp. M24T3]EIC83603.1 Extracytoplasmic function sigma factor YlaC [Serratia sp. M24T3]